MKKEFASLVLVIGLFISIFLCSCMEKAKPEDTIYKFEKAFNNYDVKLLLECYEPSVQTMYAGVMEIGGALLGGIDLKTIVQGLGGFVNIYGDSLIPQINIVINSLEEISEDKVSANLTIRYIYNEETMEEDTKAYLVYINGTWYFSAKMPMI